MRGPYSEYAAPPIYIYPEKPKAGIRFSRVELVQLTIAILALSTALTLLYARGLMFAGIPYRLTGPVLVVLFATSLIAVATGVGLHEIAHKAVAQRYGLWAEFRYNPMGLVLAFIFAVAIGFIYGAPGATWISGYVSADRNGKISAAGPATNLIFAGAFLGLFGILTTVDLGGGLAGIAVVFVAQNVALINVILAGFNMVPIMPLDGAKVWVWNKPVYIGIVVIVVALLVAGAYLGLF